MRRGPAANEKEQVRSYPTPSLLDVVFYEYRDYTLPKNQNPEYGVTTPEHGNWPNHKLGFISPVKEDGHQKWVYVAKRENQDDYNYELNGDSLVRTYVIPRAEYHQLPIPANSGMVVGGTLSPDATAFVPEASLDFNGMMLYTNDPFAASYPLWKIEWIPDAGTTGYWRFWYWPENEFIWYSWTSDIAEAAAIQTPDLATGWTPVVEAWGTPTGIPTFTPGIPESDEFYHPPAGAESPDAVFTAYCFADDTVVRSNDPEIDSRYVVIKRRFIRPLTVDYVYDAQFKRNIRITKEIIPKTTASPALASAGTSVEIQDGNNYHSVRITKELVLEGSEIFPYALPNIPATQDYRFPSKLESVDLVCAWAFAGQLTPPIQRQSYSEDYYFKFKITDPRPGPYSATILRWVTDDPDGIKTANPVTIVPQPIRESIAVASAWFFASREAGNATSATAKEWSVPPTIHELVNVGPAGTFSTSKAQDRSFTTSLAATPNVTAFLALTEAVIDYRVREMAFGLYEVSVIKLDITGLYT